MAALSSEIRKSMMLLEQFEYSSMGIQLLTEGFMIDPIPLNEGFGDEFRKRYEQIKAKLKGISSKELSKKIEQLKSKVPLKAVDVLDKKLTIAAKGKDWKKVGAIAVLGLAILSSLAASPAKADNMQDIINQVNTVMTSINQTANTLPAAKAAVDQADRNVRGGGQQQSTIQLSSVDDGAKKLISHFGDIFTDDGGLFSSDLQREVNQIEKTRQIVQTQLSNLSSDAIRHIDQSQIKDIPDYSSFKGKVRSAMDLKHASNGADVLGAYLLAVHQQINSVKSAINDANTQSSIDTQRSGNNRDLQHNWNELGGKK